ncbi:hypothetical protein [Pseudomonas sp.]|uniref:hypothetical protein n=1 Tax=Pseudomonas sp. TaxID=306 RepID=UPI0028A5E35A|nr:hypothetical protein [Pseudomonas sp.]
MAGYSRDDIVAGMKGKNITLGWGAVTAFNRSRINHVLNQQYLSRLHELRFLPLFNGEVPDESGLGWNIQLHLIEFGAPRLSFHTASMHDSKAMLTMNIIGGSLGKRNPLSDSDQAQGDLTEGMGYYLEMEVDLKLAVGKVDRRGRVTLDLAKGARFNSNLLQGAAADALSRKLEAWFAQLPEHRTVFELGFINYHGYTALAPTSFILYTQAAPGAALRHADNYGDGAVLAFIRLAGNDSDGQRPDSRFPYLIPNDRDGSGEDMYSATLVVASNLLEHVTDKRLEVLNSLLFPGQQVFSEVGRDTPQDLAVFGRITPHHAMLTVSPSTGTLRPGGTLQFDLLDAKGKKLVASAWRATSIKSHRAVAHGVISDTGLYRAASASDMGHETLTVVVTADYEFANTKETVSASARVLVTHEAIELAQRLDTLPSTLPSLALNGSHASGASLSWTLLAPELGSLQPSGAGTVFTPSSARRKVPIALQQVQVEQGDQVRAGVLLLNAHYALRLKSAPGQASSQDTGKTMQRVKPGEAVQFTFDADDFFPGAALAWRALGDGTVTAQGLYTASANVSSGVDAVVCDLEHEGVLFSGAYNALQISTLAEESSWRTITKFDVSLPANRQIVYGNRYMQQQFNIVVETNPVGTEEYQLSRTEEASMELVELKSNDGVPPLPEASEGIEDDQKYGTRTLRNNFKLYGQAGVKDDPYERRLKTPGTTTYVTRFLHVNDPSAASAKFYARFTKDGGGEYTSLQINPITGTAEVTVLPSPTHQLENYKIERKRVKGIEPGPEGRPGDEYYLEYRSRDYWQFRYLNADFVTAEFLNKTAEWKDKEKVNFSMIRWESEHRNEVMASYTGFIFDDRLRKVEPAADEDEENTRIVEFDEGLDEVLGYKVKVWGNDVESTAFSSGMAVICNDRLDDIPYKPLGEQAYLAEPMVIKFVDEYGNAHHIEFSYGPTGQSGDRNVVSWALVRNKE